MDFSAMSASNSLNVFPARFIGKPERNFLLLWKKTPLRCRTNRLQTTISTLTEESHIPVTVRCTGRRNDEKHFDLVSGNGWIHYVGIGGCGLSALAMLALKQGFEVSGSDIFWSSFMDGLQEDGACLHIGHSVSNMQRNNGSSLPDAVVMSSAIPQDNVEILYAKSVEVPIYKRDYWLGKLTENFNLIAVSGSHGKSTTTSMLAYVLKAMGDDLTTIVGACVPQFGGRNVISGGGQNFVLEADEYDSCFLGLLPHIAIVTSVEWEHVDIFQDQEAVISIFRRFLKQIRVDGHLILCGDSVGAYSLLSHSKLADNPNAAVPVPNPELCGNNYRITTYGISSFNELHASSVCPNSLGGSDYTLCYKGHPVADIRIQIPGIHNVCNSLAVIATVIALFSDQRSPHETINCIKLHLKNFGGVSRRFETVGRIGGCQVYDDYAHHPTEVRAVIEAARQRFPSKTLLVVFQPHTYSRLAALMNEFATAFIDADQVVVTKIYGARETNIWNVSGRDLATSIIGPPSEYIPCLGDVVDKLVLEISRDPDGELLVLTLGAGDITTVGPKLLHELQQILQGDKFYAC